MSLPRRIGLGALALALLLAGLGLFPQDALRRVVERRMQSVLGPGSRLGRLHLVPVLLRAEMEEILIRGPGFSLQVPRARVALAPAALLHRAPILRSLELDSPRLELWPAPRSTAEPPDAVKGLRIDDVAVRDATVHWKDPDPAKGALVSGLSARGAIGAGRLELEVRELVWRGERPLSFGPASATIDVSPSLDVTLDSLQAQAGASRLSAHGPLVAELSLRPDLTVEGQLDLSDGARWFGLMSLSGKAELSGRVQGEGADLRLAARLVGDVAWSEWRAEEVEIEASHRLAASHTELSVAARALGGRVEGEALFDGSHTKGELRGRALDLGPLTRTAVRTARVSADVDLAWEGPIDGRIHVEARAKTDGRSLEGALRVDAAARGAVQPRDFSADFDWTAGVSGEVRKAASLVAGARLDATLAGRVAIQGDRVTASAGASGINLASLVPGGARGTASLALDVSGPLRRPWVSFRASVDSMGWQGASFGPLGARLEGNAQRARLQVELPELKLKAEGDVLGSRRLRGRLRFDDTPLDPFVPLLVPEAGVPVTGRLAAGVDYDVPLDRPSRGNATLEVARLEVERAGRALRAEPFRATLHEGRIAVADLRIDGPGLKLVARADAGLRPADSFELRSDVTVDLPALPLPEGWSAVGTARGDVSIRGSRGRHVVEGSVVAHGVTLRAPSLPEIRLDEAELALEGDRVRIARLDSRIGGGTAQLTGELPFAAVFSALRSEGRGLSPTHLVLRWDGVSLEPIGGPLAGELTIEGGLASFREPRAVLSLPHTRVQVQGQSLEILPTSFQLEGGLVTASDLTLRTERGDLVVTGSADVVGRTVDVRGRGQLELGTLSPLIAAAALGGMADVDLGVSGPFDAPHARGSVHVREGSLRLRALPQALTGIEGSLALDGTHATLTATGQMGGGTVELGGEAEVSGTAVHDVQLLFAGRGVALHYPPGLRSRFDADLVLFGRTGAFVLDGDVAVERGLYEIDVAVEEALRAPEVAGAESELLRGVGLDVRVRLPRAVLVRSILGQLEVTGQLAARGDLQEPLPFGRLDVRPGGKLFLQGREFTVRDGAMTYSGSWNPELALNADAVIPSVEFRDYRVRVSAEGTIEKPGLTFSSEPSLSQQEIVSLIATGRLEGRLTDTSAWLVGGQAGALLAGRLTRDVAQTFGLDEITIRPDLVARETDPSARFTFGKNLGRRAGLVYSVGLGGPETRFVQLEGRPGRHFTLKLQRTDAATYAGGVGQRFHWGEAERDEASSEAQVRLRDVRLEGEPVEETVRKSLPLGPGSRASEWKVQDEAERLRDRLRSRGHLDAEVAARLEDEVAVFTIRPGPVYSFRVEGVEDPPDLAPIVRRALFAEEALDSGRERLLGHLQGRGHLRAEVVASTHGEGDRRTLVFSAQPGPRFESVTVSFPGASALSDGDLREAAGGAARLLNEPELAISGIREAYRRRHFLGTTIGAVRVEESAERLTVGVPIEEGPPARLAAVRFEGASLAQDLLRSRAGLSPGEAFSDAGAEAAVTRVRNLYLSLGYPAVRVRPQLVAEGTDFALVLRISEGDALHVEEIVLSGNTRTRDSLVRRALGLRAGDPLDPRRLARAEQRLLGLGVFSRAAIVPRPKTPAALDVQLEEGPNLTAAYDVRWDDEAGASALVEGEARNLLGTGLAIGARYQFGGDLRETRGSLFLPALLGVGDLTGSVFRLEQDFTADDFEIVRLQRGFQLQQSLRLKNRFELLGGYRFRRNTTLAPGLPADPIDVAGLDLSLLRNTRDDLLDPRQGRFLSLNLELSPRVLGSDAPFVKGYAQADVARSFADGSLTWAQSYRLGLAWGFEGEPVISFERFHAGGAGSLRGFGTNEVGPRSPLGDPAGGEAVVILNQELRYRHRSGLGAVVFYDLGNVFARVRDLSLNLRHTLGAGLRWASPVGLLRIDAGFPLDRQGDERRYRLFFGLGQAF